MTTADEAGAHRSLSGFFGVQQRGERWSFTDPRGAPFFSVGVNHADETNLKYPSNREVWRRRYGSRAAWITDGVVRDLTAWGFNTIGWTAECVSLGEVKVNHWNAPYNAMHSSGWAAPDFVTAGMPYCIALPAAPIEGWNINPEFPDVFSREWQDWCAYLGRSLVADHADAPNLIGYFFVDVPAWSSHPTGAYFPGLEPGDDAALGVVAARYYQTMHDAIRMYDSNHLILGDRFNGNVGIPDVVLDAMGEYVDVLSVQYFPGATSDGRQQMREDLARWHRRSGKPVLIADIGNWCATTHNAHRASELADQGARGEDYIAAFDAVISEPWLVGWHWCSYLENYSRGWGLKSPDDEPYDDLVERVAPYNASIPSRLALA